MWAQVRWLSQLFQWAILAFLTALGICLLLLSFIYRDSPLDLILAGVGLSALLIAAIAVVVIDMEAKRPSK